MLHASAPSNTGSAPHMQPSRWPARSMNSTRPPPLDGAEIVREHAPDARRVRARSQASALWCCAGCRTAHAEQIQTQRDRYGHRLEKTRQPARSSAGVKYSRGNACEADERLRMPVPAAWSRTR